MFAILVYVECMYVCMYVCVCVWQATLWHYCTIIACTVEYVSHTRTSSHTRKVKYMYTVVLMYMDITWVSSHVCFCAGSCMHAVGREVLCLDVDISKKHFSRDFR